MRYAVLIATIFALIGCATTTVLETVYVPAQNSGWKVGSGNNRPGSTLVEFIPAGESISSWSRMFTIQFLEGTRESPRAVMSSLQAQAQSHCSGVHWAIVSEDTASITYQWSIFNCPGQPDQIEIARLLKGNDGVHRIAYVRKGTQFEQGESESWLSAFSKAYVEKDGKRVVVAP